jgi:hypothetical protein
MRYVETMIRNHYVLYVGPLSHIMYVQSIRNRKLRNSYIMMKGKSMPQSCRGNGKVYIDRGKAREPNSSIPTQ